MWSRLIRDAVAPLAGIGIEVYEAVWARPQSATMIAAGLALVYGPLDAVTALIGRRAAAELEAESVSSRSSGE